MNSLTELLAERERIDNNWTPEQEPDMPLPTNDEFQRLCRQMFRALDNRVGADLGDLELRRYQNQCGRYLFNRVTLGKTHLQAADQVWPEQQPPPSQGTGMDHDLDTLAARVIGYPGGNTWFLPSRLRPGALSDTLVIAAITDPNGPGDAVWYSLSTGHRPKMNETPFDCRTNWQATVDRMGLINDQGVQVIPELGTQEFFAQTLHVSAYEDYCEDIAQRLAGLNLCKLVFPFREMPDHEAWPVGMSAEQRVTNINRVMRATQTGLSGSGIRLGLHLRSDEAPSVGMLSGIANPYWLAQVSFSRPIDQPFQFEGDNHSIIFDDSAFFLQYWATNRAQFIPGLKTIAFEHSLPPNNAGYPGISAAAAEARGAYILQHAPAVVADYSGGARR